MQRNSIVLAVILIAIIATVFILQTPTNTKSHADFGSTCSDASALTATDASSPIIVNYTKTADPNDIITLQGGQFGSNPQVLLYVVSPSDTALAIKNSTTKIPLAIQNQQNLDTFVSAVIPKTTPKGLYAVFVTNGTKQSVPVFINKSSPTQYEFSEVPSGTSFRMFGRNMSISNQTPKASFIATDDPSLTPIHASAQVINPYTIKITTPNLTVGKQYYVYTNNGLGGCWGDGTVTQSFSQKKVTLTARTGGADPFDLADATIPTATWSGQIAWASDFTSAAATTFDVTKSPYNVVAGTNVSSTIATKNRDGIQLAINDANKKGGGTVYIPQGTYKIEFLQDTSSTLIANNIGSIDGKQFALTGLQLLSNVVIKGDGPNTTSLQFGFDEDHIATTSSLLATFLSETPGTLASGLLNITFENTQTVLPHAQITNIVIRGSNFFAKNMSFIDHLSSTDGSVINGTPAFNFSQGTNILLEDTTITEGARADSGFQFLGTSNIIVRHNAITFLRNRNFGQQNENVIVEDNTIARDGDLLTDQTQYGGVGDSGHLDFDWARNIVIQNNTLTRIGKELPRIGTGETILSQGCYPQTIIHGAYFEFGDLGVASSAANLANNTASLTDLSKVWELGPNHYLFTTGTNQRYFVAIVAGTGVGQYRHIVDSTPSSIIVDQPWDILPDSTSHYVINDSEFENGIILNNTISHSPLGIELYCGGNNVVIDGNSINEVIGGIMVRSDQRIITPARGTTPATWYGRYDLSNDFLIQHNTISTTESAVLNPTVRNQNTASIYVEVVQIYATILHGIGALGIDIKNNLLSYPDASTNDRGLLDDGYIFKNGYLNFIEIGPHAYAPFTAQTGILGTIFDQNTAIIATPSAQQLPLYSVNSGADGTIIRDTTFNLTRTLSYVGTTLATLNAPNGPNDTMLISSDANTLTITPTPSTTFVFPHVFLHGVGAAGDNVNPLPTLVHIPTPTLLTQKRDVTVQLFKSQTDTIPFAQTTGQLSYQPTTGDFGGSIIWNNPTNGTYYLRVLTPRYLRKDIPNIQTIVSGNSYTMPQVALIAGDVDGDNALSIADYNIIADCGSFTTSYPMIDPNANFHSSKCQAHAPTTQVANADLDDNGIIDQLDETLLLRELSVETKGE